MVTVAAFDGSMSGVTGKYIVRRKYRFPKNDCRKG
jgi:hypothetical protein